MRGCWVVVGGFGGNYFVRSGYVSPYSGCLNDAGSYGLYWSGRAYSSGSTYGLRFTSSSVYPSGNLSRYYGSSVRCVAGWE